MARAYEACAVHDTGIAWSACNNTLQRGMIRARSVVGRIRRVLLLVARECQRLFGDAKACLFLALAAAVLGLAFWAAMTLP